MEVFQAFGQGLMSGTDSWKDVLSTNVTFKGPVDQISGLDAFTKLNEAFMPMIMVNEMKQIVESGDFVITQVLLWMLKCPRVKLFNSTLLSGMKSKMEKFLVSKSTMMQKNSEKKWLKLHGHDNIKK